MTRTHQLRRELLILRLQMRSLQVSGGIALGLALVLFANELMAAPDDRSNAQANSHQELRPVTPFVSPVHCKPAQSAAVPAMGLTVLHRPEAITP